MSGESTITADFAAGSGVHGVSTLRTGGVSTGHCESLNLATHVGDSPACVAENRRRIEQRLGLPSPPVWLDQCHGTRVAVLDDAPPDRPPSQTDAAVTHRAGRVLAVLTADCLPVLLSSRVAGVIAVAHAGWRGLAAGVIEETIAAMRAPAGSIDAWLGPAIGPQAFEVGREVRTVFLGRDPGSADCFETAGEGKWLADLPLLARRRLAAAGVNRVTGGTWCTYSEPERFFSYRRDGECGRMASLLWMVDPGEA